ncbi:dihydrolipoamide acetyltransferase family protein [Rhodococcus koreensis]|uniref:dihydrolipoamide acetyltransferase family protein n=1 Tax=Rhodococcus koreensis TaxID=99653 RepID=UPI0036D7D296
MLELTDIHMPHMGSVEFALLTEWLIKPGEEVNEGDALCEVSTDKVDTEVESPESGILISYVAAVEQEVPVGDVIARFAPADSDPEQVARAIAAAIGEQGGEEAGGGDAAVVPSTPATSPSPASGSPVAPAVAFEESKPPTNSLVLAASWFSPVNRPPEGARRGRLAAARDNASAGELASKSGFLQSQTSVLTVPAGYEDVAYTETEHTRLRRAIAKNLTESWNTAPQLTAQVDVDFSAVSVARAKVNRDRASRGEAKLSYLPFIAIALCRAIAEHPVVNATFTDTHLLQWQTVNLGIAVDTPDGLLVPVIRDAQLLSLAELSDAVARTSTALANGTGRPEDLAGGTITISNSGSVGGVVSTPILTKPQVASLGVPAIVRTPVARRSADGASELLTIRPIARLGLTFDHRAFDGAEALRALMSVQKTLENWPSEG